MSVLSLSYGESDVYWRHNNKHFAELAPQNGGKQLIWGNYVTVTLCIACELNKAATILLPITSSNADRFSFFFTTRLNCKFAMKSSLNIPPLLKDVATLPREISTFNKLPCSRTEWSKLQCKTQPVKTFVEKNSCTVMLALFNSLTKRYTEWSY